MSQNTEKAAIVGTNRKASDKGDSYYLGFNSLL